MAFNVTSGTIDLLTVNSIFGRPSTTTMLAYRNQVYYYDGSTDRLFPSGTITLKGFYGTGPTATGGGK